MSILASEPAASTFVSATRYRDKRFLVQGTKTPPSPSGWSTPAVSRPKGKHGSYRATVFCVPQATSGNSWPTRLGIWDPHQQGWTRVRHWT